MPRVTLVKKARKDNSVCKAGESYYWWKFRYGGKHLSRTYPTRSQLTQSNFYATLWDAEDNLSTPDDVNDIQRFVDDLNGLAEDIRGLGEECQSSYDNMPEGLQEGDTGQLLETRVEECERLASEIEDAASEAEGAIPDDLDTREDYDDLSEEDQEERDAADIDAVDAAENVRDNIGWDIE